MKRLPLATAILLLTLSVPCFAQGDTAAGPYREFRRPYREFRRPYRETALKLLIGGSLQQAYGTNGKEYSRKYFEIGLHRTRTAFGGHHPATTLTHGFSLEVAPEAKPIYGFKYSAWAQAWCFVLGLGGVYYTDFDQGNFKIRPEIGVGLYPFKLSAGLNIPTIRNRDFKPLQRSQGQVTLNILLKGKTLKREE
ncbi:MAG TPA: hypothetical protein VHK69_22110 [Chitinophagaceae bacterium]|jgi:hypothetical protein|nr:hypothetical protein [Chitinophagaceae bacterium]